MNRPVQTHLGFTVEKCIRRVAKEITCAWCGHPHLGAAKIGPCHCGCDSTESVLDFEQRTKHTVTAEQAAVFN